MKKKTAPNKANQRPDSPSVSDLIQYYRIGKAAELLGCTTDELLQLGVIGKVEILAPVIAPAKFSWPTGDAAIPFPEIEKPFVERFDESMRIGLMPSDLAKMEAVGWTIPYRFRNPVVARHLIATAPKSFEAALAERDSTETPPAMRKLIAAWGESPTGLMRLRESALYSPWTQIDKPCDDAPKTTLEHLFVSRSEVERLREGLPQENSLATELGPYGAESGYIERHARRQLEALKVAVWLHRDAITAVVGNGSQWAREVDDLSMKWWPPSTTRRLGLDTVTSLLRSVLRDDGEKLFDQL